MDQRRLSLLLLATGIALLLAGVACWRLGLDGPLHGLLRLSPGLPIDRRVVALSAIGGLVVMGPLAIAAALWLAVRGRAADALWLAATIASGRLLVEGVKLVVLRPRPPTTDRLELVTSWSFPSSHSAGTMMTALALAVLAGGGAGPLLLALVAALAIGWSRVALAVHWPGDVFAGWGFGMAWIGVALRLRRISPLPR